MSHILTEVDEFSTNVTVVDDGDLGTAANLNAAHQALANRTLFLKNKAIVATTTDNGVPRFDGVAGKLQTSGVAIDDSANMVTAGEYTYTTAKARTKTISAFHAFTDTNDNVIISGTGMLLQSDITEAWLPVSDYLPDGAVITKLEALVFPGAARAGTNRMKIAITRTESNFTTPGALYTIIEAGIYDNAAAALQVIASATLAETVNKSAGNNVILRVIAGNNASLNNDAFYAARITWTDPGPRNY